jgi:alkanesulfonate monooxygenase
MPLRFHWSLSQAGDPFRRAQATGEMSGLPSFEAQVDLCRRAENNGIDSVLMAFGYTRPDPVVLSATLATRTRSIHLRSGRSGRQRMARAFGLDRSHSLSGRTRDRPRGVARRSRDGPARIQPYWYLSIPVFRLA